MKLRLTLILTAALAVAACAPGATPTQIAAPTQAPAAPEPRATQPPAPTSAAIGPPASGGAAIAPTRPAATPTPARVTSGRSAPGWRRIDTANPPPARFDHILALDTANNKLVVFGGRDGSKALGDTWVYDLAEITWREVQPAASPEARFGHAAAYDATARRVLIFAGQAGDSFFNDVWAFDAAQETWRKLAVKGTPPAVRYGTSAVVDTSRNLLIISHGFASGRFDDTFALDLATNTWSQIQPVDGQPLKRCLHEAVYDAKSDRMILFGGCSSGFGPCPQGDLWSLDIGGKDWNEVSPTGIKPSPRSNPALVGDGAGRLILFGGNTSDGPSADLWSLDIASGEWTALTPAGNAPSARAIHDAVWNPATGQMIVFGGRGSSGALNDLWVLTP